ncbi:hypothetical protein NLX83_39665 [Allokutzneria sp. A3M-2-11 16]|uniref:hypothetical protein n=1 Tax=Allokutzneria sp. A3M-2-11 16 TaxID=2962043 RepID=UPI0020B797DF|nr:hypothetical protein [Allokutzneria sp. A3M-2-11 16]MCP3805403.1 hypothetical protein [Allokutzneria sp. A3M-2-11 16]
MIILMVLSTLVAVGIAVPAGRTLRRARRLLHTQLSMLAELGVSPSPYDAGTELARWQLLDHDGLTHVAREHVLARDRVALWEGQLAEHGASGVPSALVEAMRGYADGLAAYLPDDLFGGCR